jgi:hypothetical protein
MPAKMPNPLPQPNILFKSHYKRGYTGAQAIEEEEKDARRARQQAKHDTKARTRENKARSQELCQERIAHHKQEEAYQRQSIQEYATKVIEQRQQQGFITPNPALDHNPDPKPSIIDLATLSSDKLLDPLITQVAKNETDSESKAQSGDEVILSSYPLEASTSI